LKGFSINTYLLYDDNDNNKYKTSGHEYARDISVG